MRVRANIAAALVVVCAAALSADVRTTERTTVKFEGMLGRMVGLFGGGHDDEPRTVAVRGGRKATLSKDGGQIIDLTEEKIYDLDARRRTYEITTFEELRRRMEEARKDAGKDIEEERDEPAREGEPEYEIDFDVRETGERRTLAGHDTKQVVATVTMRKKGRTLAEGGGLVLTSDMWLAPRVVALDEIAAFDRRYAEQLYGMTAGMSADQLAALLAAHPGFAQAQARLAEEGAKLEGTPLLTTVTLDSVKDPAARDGGSGGGVGGLAGRLMRRNRDKPGTPERVFTSTHEVLSIDTTVSDADVAIPAGFREKQ